MGAPDPRGGEAPVKPKREIDVAEGQTVVVVPAAADVAPPAVADDRECNADRSLSSRPQQSSRGSSRTARRRKEKLIRRAYFDLIGLPPTPEQVDAFVERHLAAGVREGGRRAAREPALRREVGPALARCGPLRRKRRLRVRRLPARRLPLSRLGDPRAQRRPAVRRVRADAAGRRQAAARRLSRRRRHRLSRRRAISGPDHGQDRRADPLRPARRHADDDRRLDARPDARLRPLPRPQVRSAFRSRIITPWPRRWPAPRTARERSIPIPPPREQALAKHQAEHEPLVAALADVRRRRNCRRASRPGSKPNCRSSRRRRAGKCSNRSRWRPSDRG